MTGRPTIRTQEIEDTLLEGIADGRSIADICSAEDMPARSTIFRWLSEDQGFSDLYARAKEAQAECLADELLQISDDGSNDWMERRDEKTGDCIGWRENGEAIQRSKLRVDTRKWVAARLLPRKYGDKVETTLTGQLAVEHVKRSIVKAD
jgi:hypothetical protein